MAEFLFRHPRSVSTPRGTYAVTVWAEPFDGMWAGWIQFEMLESRSKPLHTARETTQVSRAEVRRWGQGLNRLFLEGAFRRARRAKGGRPVSQVIDAREVRIPARGGPLYGIRIFAEEEPHGTWLGTIELTPPDGKPVSARRETSQPSRAQVVYWSEGLEPLFFEGALDRAKRQSRSTRRPVRRRVAARRPRAARRFS